MPPLSATQSLGPGKVLRDLVLLAFLSAILLYSFSGTYPLANPDEGRNAEIAREMVQSGDWVLPRLNGVIYYEKPPLVYWLNAVGLSVGLRSEWALRAVPVGFGVLGLLFTWLGAASLGGRRAGWIAAALAGSCLMWFMLAHILILDMAVSALITGTLVCFLRGVLLPAGAARRAWFLGLYACAALAVLAKGLIGLALPGAIMFLWLLVFRQWRHLLPMHLLSGGLLFLAIAAPWHLLAWQRDPSWAWYYFVHEHWLRFTTTIHDRAQPWWYFIPMLLAGFLPWSFHVVRGVVAAFRNTPRGQVRSALWFLVLWAAFIFLFFSRSQSKLPPYILPMFPALAILAGVGLAASLDKRSRWAACSAWGFSCFVVLLGAAAFTLAVKPSLVRDAAIAAQARPQLLILGLLLVLSGLWSLHLHRMARFGALLRLQVLALSFALLTIGSAAHLLQRNSKVLALLVAREAGPSDQIFHYRCFAHDFVYYSERFVGLVDHVDELKIDLDREARGSGRFIERAELERRWAGPDRIWLLCRRTEAAELRADPSGRYLEIADNGRYFLFSNRR